MKSLIFLMFLLYSCGKAVYAQPHRSTSSYHVVGAHPRLLLLHGQERKLLHAIRTDRFKLKVHHNIMAECERLLNTEPVKHKKIGMRMLAVSREAMLRIFYLSYGWRVTKELKYLKRAEQELYAISNFKDWNPTHFLDVSEMTIAASIGYDWLYPELSPDLRLLVKNAIIEKGLIPSFNDKYNWWLKVDHNWNQVCNAGMTFGALAIYEDSTGFAQKIINRAKRDIHLPMHAYEPDGAYPEGYMYWGYGTTFNVMFISAIETAFGKEFDLSKAPGFLNTAYFMQNMTGPTGDCFNFSDADLGGVLQPAMFWFAQKNKNPSLLWVEKEHMMNLAHNVREDMRILPLTLIWGLHFNMEKISAPNNTVWVGKGRTPVALMRSSWTDTNAVYVGFKGGSPSTNHGHMDIGSFVMEADGVRWATDLGRQNYASLEAKNINIWNFSQQSERWKVFRYSNFAHNTLTVNNNYQVVDGYASLISYSDKLDSMSAKMDMSSLYQDLKEAKRQISIIGKKYVKIQDDLVTGAKECLVRWSMVTSAKIKIYNNKATLEKEGKKLIFSVKGSPNIKLRTWSTVSENDFDADNKGTVILGFETKVPANTRTSLVVLLLPQN